MTCETVAGFGLALQYVEDDNELDLAGAAVRRWWQASTDYAAAAAETALTQPYGASWWQAETSPVGIAGKRTADNAFGH